MENVQDARAIANQVEDFFAQVDRRVEIDSDNWVVIKRLTFGETKKSLELAMKQIPGSNELVFDQGIIQMEQMVSSIVSWEGPGFGGRPVSRENILALPSYVGDLIASEISDLNAPVSDDEKKE
ncbi:MAG: hypothetical protein AAF702_44450 [Chloroflexota bacterium]